MHTIRAAAVRPGGRGRLGRPLFLSRSLIQSRGKALPFPQNLKGAASIYCCSTDGPFFGCGQPEIYLNGTLLTTYQESFYLIVLDFKVYSQNLMLAVFEIANDIQKSKKNMVTDSAS